MIRFNIIIALLLLAIAGCYDDTSSLASKEIIEIQINAQKGDSINLYFNDTLRIPIKLEADTDKLTYEWGIGQYQVSSDGESKTVYKKISEEKDLEYIPKSLGHYHLRQIVTSVDGSAIKYYHVFVNSPFEEGYLILGRQENGKGSISFLKTLTPEEVAMGMEPTFVTDAYSYANDGEELYVDPVDCDKVENYLYILHRETGKLVQIDAKTFQKVFEYDFNYYEGNFKPSRMAAYDGKYCRDFYVPSINGGVCMVQTMEQFIFPYKELPKGYTFVDVNDRPSYFSSVNKVYIGRKDSDKNNVVCWNAADGDRVFAMRTCNDYFQNREILGMFQTEHSDGNDVYTLNRDGGQIKVTAIHRYMINLSTGDVPWILFERVIDNPSVITENTCYLTNDFYYCVFITHQNKVFRWFYNQPNSNIGQTPFVSLPDGEEICSISHYTRNRGDAAYQDHSVQKEFFVATYNANRVGELKGSLYVFDADTGELKLKHEGISHKPIDVMYKIK
ncbi:MAG: hypothetical protein ACRDDZ_03210 [Marinifilaceae bacterium]